MIWPRCSVIFQAVRAAYAEERGRAEVASLAQARAEGRAEELTKQAEDLAEQLAAASKPKK